MLSLALSTSVAVADDRGGGADYLLAGRHVQLRVAAAGAGVEMLRLCLRACAPDSSAGPVRVVEGGRAHPVVALRAPDTPELDRRLRALRYHPQESGPGELILLSEPLMPDLRVEQHYRLLSGERRIAVRVVLRGPGAVRLRRRADLALRVATDEAFGRTRAAGFTAMVETARPVAVRKAGVTAWEAGTTIEMPAGGWSGLRNRFWALLGRSAEPLSAVAASRGSGRWTVTLRPERGRSIAVQLYAGPVDPTVLSGQPGDLDRLWLSALWDWLRGLAFGLYWLLEQLHALLGHYGLAIVALALAVKTLMLPLTILASRWQRQVNVVQARMGPELQRIKAEYRGEQQAEAVLALHRSHGVTPLYPLRSLFGVLIQLPVFIGAFDMLLHHPGLAGAQAMWIEDLARPDRFAALPGTMPFFGAYLNLLPFVMTGVNVLAARHTRAAGLEPGQHRRRQYQLYGVALAFFVLFYTFPAAMLLYWTSNNLLHLLGEQVSAFFRRAD